jgi:hypothetical protein
VHGMRGRFVEIVRHDRSNDIRVREKIIIRGDRGWIVCWIMNDES